MTHVFICYVRENESEATRLCDDLTAEGVEVWIDRRHILPGKRWKNEIQQAIRAGSYFVACFSPQFETRERGYAYEELKLAVEELRQRPAARSWFIPVRLASCSVPDLPIGGGETVQEFHWVDLFPDWDQGVRRLLDVVHPGMGEQVLSQLRRTRDSLTASLASDLDNRIRHTREILKRNKKIVNRYFMLQIVNEVRKMRAGDHLFASIIGETWESASERFIDHYAEITWQKIREGVQFQRLFMERQPLRIQYFLRKNLELRKRLQREFPSLEKSANPLQLQQIDKATFRKIETSPTFLSKRFCERADFVLISRGHVKFVGYARTEGDQMFGTVIRDRVVYTLLEEQFQQLWGMAGNI